MATIKSYTTLGQSRELAKFLPLSTADMCYKCIGEDPYDVTLRPYSEWKEEYKGLLVDKEVDVIPCWSLTALLNVLPNGTNIIKEEADTENEKYMCTIEIKDDVIPTFANNPVNACYEMILKLHGLNLL
jgi:hypothetical protein